MSYDVLDALRRRLGATDRPAGPHRRATARSESDWSPPATLVADGGGPADGDDDAHLRDLPDGAGCVEIWEHLSEEQARRHRSTDDGGARECRADD